MHIKALQEMVHELAVTKGWHEIPMQTHGVLNVAAIAEKLLMLHSEVSEATEELRDAMGHVSNLGLRVGVNGKPEGFAVEIADLVIRSMDLCGALGIDLEKYIILKHAYNETRPHRHGGKAL